MHQKGQTLLDLAQNRSVIHLVRQNVLRMYLSDLLAERVSKFEFSFTLLFCSEYWD